MAGQRFEHAALELALVAEAVDLAGERALVNIFAGFAAGTRAALDLDAVLRKGIYLFGTSGSEIPDMLAVLAKLERGELDTNISVDAICGMEGVGAALAAVEARTTGGKIVVYPALHELGLVRLAELAERLPTVAAALALTFGSAHVALGMSSDTTAPAAQADDYKAAVALNKDGKYAEAIKAFEKMANLATKAAVVAALRPGDKAARKTTEPKPNNR